MHFTFVVKKWANFYFFVQNLSRWHFSNVGAYNDFWRKQVGPFTAHERRLLGTFRRIHQYYANGNKPFSFSHIFYSKRYPLKELKRRIRRNEHQSIQKTFSTFKNKFDKLYTGERILLLRWQKTLTDYWSHTRSSKKIIPLLSSLYRVQPPPPTFRVVAYLLISSPGAVGGSADADYPKVTLEVSRAYPRSLPKVVSTLWHEIIHLYFDKPYFRVLLNKELPNNKEMARRVNEVTAAALFPGVLAERLLQSPRKEIIYHRYITKEQTKKILTLIKSYVRRKIPLDGRYVRRVRDILTSAK